MDQGIDYDMLEEGLPLFTDMVLPMVTCPLCCRPGFSTPDSLCSALINVTSRKLCCPVCNVVVIGLDKFTFHLFTHCYHKYSIEQKKDPIEIYPSCNDDTLGVKSILPCNDSFQLSCVSPHSFITNGFKLQSNSGQDSSCKTAYKDEWRMSANNIVYEPPKSLKISDTSIICFHADTDQVFTIASEGLSTSLNNVTINTQNYITNTNITTSTLKTNVVEKVQKRKLSQFLDRDDTETFCKPVELDSPDNYSFVGSVNSWPSSVSSETDKLIVNNTEQEFESCKDLLTKGDFSTLNDDGSETEGTKDVSCHSSLLADDISEDSNDTKDNPIKKDSMKCDLCSYAFPNKTILAMHKQLIHKKNEPTVEHKQKMLLCNLCPRTFSLRSSLMIHRRVAHAGGFGSSGEAEDNLKQTASKPACQVCGKFFKKEIHLTQHMKAHDDKQWQCTICSKTFTTKYFLKKHRRLHTGETPYKCNTCSKSFTFQQSYHKHLLYHNDEKPYCCAQCGRLFKELSTLHNHERIHSGEKPFSCETCGKAFRQRVSYLVHRRIHTGAMPYQCTACNKRFRYKISQRTHKCTVNPPGVVLRTTGSLVERLQAAMIKAETGNENKKDALSQMNAENDLSLQAEFNASDELHLNRRAPAFNQADGSIKGNSKEVQQKSFENETKIPDKPKIYLLVKGPNEETYYQPLLLPQNVSVKANFYEDSSLIQDSKVNSFECKSLDKSYPDLEMDTDQSVANSVNTSVCLHNGKEHSIFKTVSEEGNEHSKVTDGKIIGNDFKTTHSSIDEKKSNEKIETNLELSQCSVDISSNESAMTDFIIGLANEFSELKNNNYEMITSKVDGSNSETCSDLLMMDSTDLFSLILSPSFSAPEHLSSVSPLSPNNEVQTLVDNNLGTSKSYIDQSTVSIEEQDCLFHNINDEALKDLFGMSK